MLALLFPATSEASYASCTDSSSEDCVATQLSTDIDVTTNTSISLSLASAVKLEATPTSSGTISYSSTKLSVATNSQDGYAIYMQAGSEDGALKGVTSNLDGQISNTTKRGVTLDELDNNTYGYALTNNIADNTTAYSGIPTTGTIIKSTGTATPESGDYAYGDTYYLSFGTKIGTSLPAGVYSGSVNVSVVANPVTLRSLYDLTYMQEMTPAICDNTKEHYTKQLIDNRDGKKYWVAKLKDGRCWMTQNLAFDIKVNADGTSNVKAADSDVASDWNTTLSTGVFYPPAQTRTALTFESIADSNVSWNTGEWVITNPSDTDEYCGDSSSIGYCSNMTNVAGWSPTLTATATSSVNTADHSYDAHYLIGNYYQWNAAVAGTGDPNEDEEFDATSSICPKGWTLPNESGDNSMEKLLGKYGVMLGETNSGYWNIMSNAPLYFVLSGNIDVGSDDPYQDVNFHGDYWSSRTYNHAMSYETMVYTDEIKVPDTPRSEALSIRCINTL